MKNIQIKYAFFLLFLLAGITYLLGRQCAFDINIKYRVDDEATIQIFTLGEDDLFFTETQSYSVQIPPQRSLTKVNLKNKDLVSFRLDFDGTQKLIIEDIEVSFWGISMCEINTQNCNNYLVLRNDCSINMVDDEFYLISEGSDSYVVFDIDDMHIPQWGYAVILLASIILTILFLTIIVCYKKHEDKIKTLFFTKVPYIKIVKVITLFCAIVSIVQVSCDVINSILQRNEIEYMVYIDKPEINRVDEGGAKVTFLNHAKSIISNNIMIRKSNMYFGEVSYSILGMNGDVLKEECENFSTIVVPYNSEWDELIIKCSGLGLEQGEEYEIVLSFNQTDPVYLIANQEGQVQQRQIMENSYKDIYIYMVIFVAIVILSLIIYAIIVGFSDKVFLISALATGIMACFIQTPCTVDDEYRHFLRVYDLTDNSIQAEHTENWINAKGNVIANRKGKADIIEVSSQANGLRLLDMRQNYDNISYVAEMNYQGCIDEVFRLAKQEESTKSYVSIVATNGIPALVYFPQIILAFIGKIWGMGAIGIYYMARLGNMLFAAFSTYLIVNKLPKYRNAFYVFYFAPNVFWLNASCNRDALVTSIVALLIAYIIYIKENKLKIFIPKRMIILSLFIIVIAISKLPYILVVGLIIILDKENISIMSNWKCFCAKVGLICLLVTVGVVGYKISHFEKSSENTANVETETPKEESHLTYALKDPQKVLSVFEKRLAYFQEDLYRAFEGYRYKFAHRYIFMALIVFLLSKKNIGIKEKLWCLVIFATAWLSIIVVGYTLKPPDYGSIWGISPRYMIPILPLLALVIALGNNKTEKVIDLIAPAWILTLSATNIISMITVFW